MLPAGRTFFKSGHILNLVADEFLRIFTATFCQRWPIKRPKYPTHCKYEVLAVHTYFIFDQIFSPNQTKNLAEAWQQCLKLANYPRLAAGSSNTQVMKWGEGEL